MKTNKIGEIEANKCLEDALKIGNDQSLKCASQCLDPANGVQLLPRVEYSRKGFMSTKECICPRRGRRWKLTTGPPIASSPRPLF